MTARRELKQGRGFFSACLVPALAGLAACSGTDTDVAGPDDGVLVQVRDYELGTNIDEVVWGPRVVVYADGTVLAEVFHEIEDGAAQHRTVRTTFERDDLDRLRIAGDRLPDVDEAGVDETATDGGSETLMINGQTWRLFGLPEPYTSAINEIVEMVESADVEDWTPERWVERAPGSGECVVVEVTATPSYANAPIYPHLFDEFPLGPIDCFRSDD